MKLSDYVASYLKELGVKYVFGYQGGAVTHLIDSFYTTDGLEYIQNYNEQGSALCADAYARVSKEKLGVAIATNGPGATNLITGIANAYCDSIPVIFLTGQVHSFAMKKSQQVRQESFQELEILSVVESITKYAVTVLDAYLIKRELDKAVFMARSGRPGPVLIDLPIDIQGMDIDINLLKDNYSLKNDRKDFADKIEEKMLVEIADQFSVSKRPLVIAGGGVRNSDAVLKLRQFVDKYALPVVSSLQGLDCMNHESDLFFGFIGGYGNRYANLAVQNADCILVLGSRLDMRQTGKRRDLFAQNAFIVHVDIDCMELGHFVSENISINASIDDFLQQLDVELRVRKVRNTEHWRNLLNNWRERYPSDTELAYLPEMMNPNELLQTIGKTVGNHAVICSDVGQNQMWTAQSLRCAGDDVRFLNSGGLGTMGYSLPAGIGAYYANPSNKIICVMGDGGLQMNVQELCLVGDRQIPLKIFVMNNHSLGLIRETHEKYYNNRCIGSVEGFASPDYQYLAKAYRLEYVKVENMAEAEKLEVLLENQKPYLIECDFMEFTYVRPELLGNYGLDQQMPLLSEEEQQKIAEEVSNEEI